MTPRYVRSVRSRLLLAVVLVVAAALVVVTVGFNVVLGRLLARNADDLLRSRANAELAILRPVGDHLVLGEAPDRGAVDRPVWVFSRDRVLERPAGAGEGVDAAARALSSGERTFATLSADDVRLHAVPVVGNGRTLGSVVVGVSLAPYEQTRRTALLASLALAGLVLLTITLAARWLLASALRPVAQMTAQAAAWSERNLDGRFALGEPHDELTRLAATLDELLDRLAASLRRERRFS